MLAAITDNTTAVWDWAPQRTPVRGCLVLGGERRPARARYDYGKGPVVLHTPATLARGLKAEAPARARRACRGRGRQARSGVRTTRGRDVILTCGPPGRRGASVPNPPPTPPADRRKTSIVSSLAHEQGFNPPRTRFRARERANLQRLANGRGFGSDSQGRILEERAPDGSRAGTGTGLAASAVRKTQSSARPPAAGR